MGKLVLLVYFGLAFWLLRRDTRRREGISPALWIPTLWAAIALSRPLTLWLGFGGGSSYAEGSPLDRLFYFSLIGLSFLVLSRRRLDWGTITSGNWPLFFFYGFFLISVVWSDQPFSSFKRWFKDFGLVPIALVILTEKNPLEAIRVVFVRCAYLWLPLSVIFIRWFPSMGRFYSSHGGQGEMTGVTTQKNDLGILAMICGLIFLWDWLEKRKNKSTAGRGAPRRDRLEGWILTIAMVMALYLLHISQSKTSLVCFIVGAGLIAASYTPNLGARIGRYGIYILITALGYYVLDSTLGLTDFILEALGRDSSFTGRTDVWNAILAVKTNPLLGTGFYSFWSNEFYQSQLPNYVAFSAHNSYLETYLDGGWLGIGVLAIMLVAVWVRISRHLKTGDRYAVVRLAIYLAIVIGCFSESHFGRLTPLWFLFILTMIEPQSVARALPGRRVLTPVPAMRVVRTG